MSGWRVALLGSVCLAAVGGLPRGARGEPALASGTFHGPVVGVKGHIDYGAPWTKAQLKKAYPTKAETRALMARLLTFIESHHLKTDPASKQCGMVYEYFDVRRKGKFDQFVQGEALDTMHDGAWLAAAVATACRATGGVRYKQFLARWQVPFYCRMLNHSDTLFTWKHVHCRKNATPWGKPWAYQEGEKGFVPYFWDDGRSVSIERRHSKNALGSRPCADHLAAAGKPNPTYLLDGYSFGMSNHMSQDLGVMAQVCWLLFREGESQADRKLAAELAAAATNLHESRMRHFGRIPMCVAPAALAAGDADLMRHVPKPDSAAHWEPSNHYTRALRDYKAGQRYAAPGFADDQQYHYYYGLARAGGRVPDALAFKVIYDAYTEPMLWRHYCDDWLTPAGFNRFDLYGQYFRDGRPEHYRSDRKGPFRLPVPGGSRMGPQNMITSGWGLQLLRARPGLWDKRYRDKYAQDLRVYVHDPAPKDSASSPKTAPLRAGAWGLTLWVTPNAFCMTGAGGKETLTLTIFGKAGGEGGHAVVTVTPQGAISAVNSRGEKLRIDGAVSPDFAFRFRLPCTVVKGQKPWANVVEHGRMSLSIGQLTRNLYVASAESQVAGRLQHELAGGLRTWEAIFDAWGYIPTGIGRGKEWDYYSDSGGYAHLISAAAQWLMVLEGTCDWEAHHVPQVLGT